MTTKTIHRLKITNYKSIDSLELEGLTPFSVFAGPNGSGKSNFFDALDFLGLFVRGGVETALREHGGFANIHSEKCSKEDAKKFGFEIEFRLPDGRIDKTDRSEPFHYQLTIHGLDGKTPWVEEQLSSNGTPLFVRDKDEILGVRSRVIIYQERAILYSEPMRYYACS